MNRYPSIFARFFSLFRNGDDADRHPRHSPPPEQEPPVSNEPTAEEIVGMEAATHQTDAIVDPHTRRKADGT